VEVFNIDLVQSLFEQRSDMILVLAQASSFLGEVEGYVVVVTLIYTCFDKGLAFRLAVVALLAMLANHFLKLLIRNPRPFVADGTYLSKWAVTPENARELASEFSTPSGHAMSASAFYAYLVASVRNHPVRALALFAIIITGLSRPYLGVHYLEDVLLGWVIGLGFAFAAIRFQARIGTAWLALGVGVQATTAVFASLIIYLLTLWSNGGDVDRQPLLFVEYLGFLTGIIAARPLEARHVDFDPKSGSIPAKFGRWLIAVAMVTLPLFGLDLLFTSFADEGSMIGHGLTYLRYAVAGFAGLFLAPLLLVWLGLARSKVAPVG
jgi:membrane-associated phospholipid phosphatase